MGVRGGTGHAEHSPWVENGLKMFGNANLHQNPEVLVNIEAAGPHLGHSGAIGLGEAQMEPRQANSQVEMLLLVRDPL